MSDDEFFAQFENCTLPLESFRHADHVRMAFVYLHKYQIVEALERFSTALSRFATAHGTANLYNETITWAHLLIIRERLARAGGSQTWTDFAACNGDLLDWKHTILKKYYRQETLDSDLAKRTFVFPDRVVAPSGQ